MVVRAWPAGSLVDQRGEIFVAVQEVSVHTRAANDHPAGDAAVFSAEFVECAHDRSPFGSRILSARVGQSRYALFVALGSVIGDLSDRVDDVAPVIDVCQQGVLPGFAAAQGDVYLRYRTGFAQCGRSIVDERSLFGGCVGKLSSSVWIWPWRASSSSSLGRASRLAHSAAPSKASTRARIALRSSRRRRISGRYDGSLLNDAQPKH